MSGCSNRGRPKTTRPRAWSTASRTARRISAEDRIAFDSRAAESLFYAILVFSPILCAGLLFGSAIKVSPSVARDYGTNLLGAMAGGVAEYMSLVTGFRMLLFVIAACYIGAVIARLAEDRRAVEARPAEAR